MTKQIQWQQSKLGGGGFITGMLQDPHRPHILYGRADVAGVFKSVDGGRTWQPKNHGMTECHQHDVQSFAISPHNSDILFRCSGSVRGGNFFGTIHKSLDAGERWFAVCHDLDFYGNGETRMYGEVIQVSPHDPALVAAGGYSGGFWLSHDTGEHWSYRGLRGERISCVVFHPSEAHTLYVGTIGSLDQDPELVRQQHDFVRRNPPRLYRTQDYGATWEVLYEGLDFGEIIFDAINPHILHAACLQAGIRKSVDGGKTWLNHAPGLSKHIIGSVALDPHHPNRLYAAAATLPNYDTDVPPIGVYTTDDNGETWRLVRWHTDDDLRHYPEYMSLPYAGWAISKIRVDTCASNILYISNWYGIATSHDAGLTWDANYFEGMENVCIESVTSHPTDPQTVYLTIADHNPFVSTDGGSTYQALLRPKVETPQPNSTAIVASRYRPDFLLYAIKGTEVSSIVVCQSNGSNPRITWQSQPTIHETRSRIWGQSRSGDVSVQALAEDPFQSGKFYAYMDGWLDSGAGLYQSLDWGETWTSLPLQLPPHIRHLPHERYWIETELLNVVAPQTKNVCGTNQLLCIDPHREGTLYIGEWTEGIFRSTDGGLTWAHIGQSLPFKHDRASVLNVLRPDIQRPGRLYAGFIREGLWYSDDYGDTWAKLFPDEAGILNTTSVAIGGFDGRRIVVVCEPLYWSPCPSAVWLSDDLGQHWQNIYDPQLGALRWKGVALASGSDTIYGGTCGNSAFYISYPCAE